MGLFQFYRKNKPELPPTNGTDATPEVRRELFVEDQDPSEVEPLPGVNLNGGVTGIESILVFLEGDYESKGYGDALACSDDSYKQQNMDLLKQRLEILIQRATNYYRDRLSELDTDIASRARAGMVDLVEELKARRLVLEDRIEQVNRIRDDAAAARGITQRPVKSYEAGFRRGLAALSHGNVLSKAI